MNKEDQSKVSLDKSAEFFDLIFDDIKLELIFLDEAKFRRESIKEITLTIENALSSQQVITEEKVDAIADKIASKILTGKLIKTLFNKRMIACKTGFKLSAVANIAVELDSLLIG